MHKPLFMMICVAVIAVTAAAQNRKIVTGAQANGVYRYYDNEFRILALGHNKLKIQFDGVYHTIARSVNIGTAGGEARSTVTSRP
jgi:hypothetical protein